MKLLLDIPRTSDTIRIATEEHYFETDAVLEDTKTPLAGDTHVDLNDSTAMFFDDNIDYSEYEGTDSGSTPYKVVFGDSSGNKASAFCGAAGPGFAASVNATYTFAADLDGFTVTNDDETATFTHDGGEAVLEVTEAGTNVARPQLKRESIASVTSKSICFVEIDYSINSGTCVLTGVGVGGAGYSAVNETFSGSDTYTLPYFNVRTANYDRLNLFFDGTNVFSLDLEEIRHKHVTEVPATGLHLFSTKNGISRGWQSVDAGFDPNDIVSIKIYSGEEVYQYRGDIKEEPEFTYSLPDVFYGIQEVDDVTVEIVNGSGYYDTLFATDEIRGKQIKYFRENGNVFFNGVVTGYTLGDVVTITATEQNEELNKLIPAKVITAADFTTTAQDIGAPVPLVYGTVRDIPLFNIQSYESATSQTTSTTANKLINSGASFSDSLVGMYAWNITQGTYAKITAKDSSTQLTVDSDIFDNTGDSYCFRCYDYVVGWSKVLGISSSTNRGVKRDGVVVDTSEYTFDDGTGTPTDHGYSGHSTIRFPKEQVDFTGRRYYLTADVSNGSWISDWWYGNPLHLINKILSNSNWGLNDSVNSASFAAGYVDLISDYSVDYGLAEQRAARDYLNELLFVARSRLYKNDDNEWCISVDQTGSSVASFGDNDGYYNNCTVTSYGVTPAKEAVKTAYVQYDNKEISLACNTGFGVDKTYEIESVAYDATAKKILSYIYGRSVYADKKLSIKTGSDASSVSVGDIVTVTAPARSISAQDFRVVRLSRKYNEFNLDLEWYDSRIFNDQTITSPTAITETESNVGYRTITGAVLEEYSLKVNAIGSIGGGTQDIDLAAGRVITATVDTSETTFAFSNFASAGEYDEWIMILTDAGSQPLTWPASVDWTGGTEPSWTSSGVDIVKFFTTDNGGTIHGRALSIDSK